MFDFLTPLTQQDFNQKAVFLIDGFIAKHLITMIYADGGHGKSFAAAGLAKYAEQNGMDVIYLDYDNPMGILQERAIERKLINACPNLHYVHRSKAQLTALDMLTALEDKAVAGAYKNTFIVLDSLRDFDDVNNDAKAMRLGEKLKNLREAGATIFVLHHSTKNGSNYQGSNNIRNSIDSMYHLQKVDAPQGEIRWVFEVKKERAAITDTALAIKIEDLSIMPIDLSAARLNHDEKIFVDAVKNALTSKPGINKTDLLHEIGFEKTDKTARDRLDQFDELYWKTSKGPKNATLYHLI